MTEQQGGGYEAMPAEQPSGAPAPARGGPAPSTVRNAVNLMYVRVVIGIISVVLTFAVKGQIRSGIEKNNGKNGAKALFPNQIDTIVNAAVIVAVVIGVVFLLLYLLLAFQVRKGKNWARIVTIVLTILGVLSALASFAQAGNGLTHLVTVVSGLLDLAILILLLLPASRPFFSRRPA